MAERKFFKTTYTVVVLSEDRPAIGMGLESLQKAITQGDCSAMVNDDGGVPLTALEVQAALVEQGSPPDFFLLSYADIEEAGNA